MLCAIGHYAAAAPVVQLDPWGSDSIRVRIAPSGGSIVEPPLMALGSTVPPPSSFSSQETPFRLTVGNLVVDSDPSTGYITATRASDGAVLLRQTGLTFGPAAPGSRPGSVSAQVSFAGTTGEAIYGLGEHRTGHVNQMPYSQLFQNSEFYPDSHGGDVSIPYYSSSLGYGFLWVSRFLNELNRAPCKTILRRRTSRPTDGSTSLRRSFRGTRTRR